MQSNRSSSPSKKREQLREHFNYAASTNDMLKKYFFEKEPDLPKPPSLKYLRSFGDGMTIEQFRTRTELKNESIVLARKCLTEQAMLDLDKIYKRYNLLSLCSDEDGYAGKAKSDGGVQGSQHVRVPSRVSVL